jgi:hypothetical protein
MITPTAVLRATVYHPLGRHTQCGLRYKHNIATKPDCLVTDLFRAVH